jgi:DMSO/TMAO reductase YedYZ molybdopterin-dependent catalytic subunit
VATSESFQTSQQQTGHVRTGALAGACAGLVLAAATLLVRALSGVPSYPEILQDRVLGAMPGAISGGIIDRLQFNSKPLVLAAIVIGQIAVGTLIGLALVLMRQQRLSAVAGALIGFGYWVVAELVVLPLAGAGPAGAGVPRGGASAGWSLIADLLFGLALAEIFTTLSAGRGQGAGTDRRRALTLIGGAVVVVAGGTAIAKLLGGGSEHGTPLSDAAETAERPNPSVPPGQFQAAAALSPRITPPDQFYIISKNLSDPEIKAQNWHLDVVGMVQRPLTLTYDQIRALPASDLTLTLECISNPVGGTLISTGTFSGPPLELVLQQAGIGPDARGVLLTSADGYTENLTLAEIRQGPTLLAHSLDGQPLPDRHGFPLRVIGPGRYGMKNPKWLTKIAVTGDPAGGYWERSGWQAGMVQTMARFDTRPAEVRAGQPVLLGGIAYAGDRGIARVEISADGGLSWQPTALESPLDGYTWVRWSFVWTPPRPGRYILVVRAYDGMGAVQTAAQNDSFPSGATGYQRLAVRAVS